jgi:DNA-binding LacI/PurR family transcriptional regulator
VKAGMASAPPSGGSRRIVGGHPTIHDVAERAGVSKSLVSLVMRGSPQVSRQKREAVLRAADELSYRPNAVARSLVRKRSFVIGVVLSNLHNPFFADVVDGIEGEAIASHYRALFNTGSLSPEREAAAVETLLQLRTDGLILAGSALSTREIVAVSTTVPVVLVTRPTRSPLLDSATNDDRAGARLAVDHLVALGHRAIAHIDGGTGAGAAARRSSYMAAMRSHGLGAEIRVLPGAFTEEGGASGVDRLLARGETPTAVFAANDLAAVGALHALEERGLRVPDDVSVVGYDNSSLAALGHINLTTIDQPRRELGAIAVRLLIERLDQGRSQARHLVVPPRLVVRRTTGPPARISRRASSNKAFVRNAQ